jgi:hypothetical protein
MLLEAGTTVEIDTDNACSLGLHFRWLDGSPESYILKWLDTGLLQLEITCPSRGSVEADEPSSFQNPVDNGGSQVLVVQHLPPFTQGLVGVEDQGPLAQVPVVHHMEKNVGGVLRVVR